jgi:hypothetical protein
MTTTGSATALSRTAIVAPGRRVEKLHAGNALNGERRGANDGNGERRSGIADRLVSRNRTAQRRSTDQVPTWRTPFVAQVLGQLISGSGRSAADAYREPAPRPALVLDARA